MQHLTHRILYLSTAGAFSCHLFYNRNKTPTVFATQISDDDIQTARSQKPDSSTETVTFSLIEDTCNEPLSNGLELRNVQIFFRHGARTPLTKLPGLQEVHFDKSFIMSYVPYSRINHVVENIKGGPRPESTGEKKFAQYHFWGGCTAGMLTALGRDQMYMLGRRLRSLYIEKLQFLDKEFNPNQIQIRSTNYNRCIESMECVIAGLYGQHSFDNKDPLVIPVHHESEETLYPNTSGCSIMQTINMEGQQYLASLEGFQNVVQEIAQRLGVQLDPKKVDMIMWRDNIMVRQALGLPVPKTLLEILPEIDYIGTYALEIAVHGPPKESDFLKRLSGMPFSKLIEDNIRNACYHPDSAPKLQMYACHDSSIVLLLSMMGCFNHHWPPYSADIRLELYEAPGCNDRYWMKILYCNKAVVMPGLNSDEFPFICLDMFYQILKRYTVSSISEYFKLMGCNMYKSFGENAENAGENAENTEKEDNKTSRRPKQRQGFWS